MKQCVLHVKDEVNVQIEGLDLDTRRRLSQKFKYELPGARHMPSVKLGRWDGTVAFFQLGGSTYINLLPEILPILQSEGYDISLNDTRSYQIDYDLPSIDEQSFSHTNWPQGHPAVGQPIVLRDYQVEIINNFLEKPQSLQEIATGAGKCLAGDTLLTVRIDETTPFGKFLRNFAEMQGFYQMIVNLPVGVLAEYIEEFNGFTLEDNKDISIEEFGIQVPARDRNVLVKRFIKKFDLPMMELTFSNGYSIRVAKKHILRQNGKDIFAYLLKVGDCVDHLTGQIRVTEIRAAKKDDCYDIAIDAPHLYYDANGLIHHNTVMTAALSHAVTPYGRSIVIVPNKSLVTQTEEDYVNLGLDVGVFYGDRKEFGHAHTICTWQSLNILLKNTRNQTSPISIQEFLEDVVCVIVDECFAGDTLIATPCGKVPIKDLKVGDKVINFCEKTKQYKEDVVVKVHKNLSNSHSERMLELEFDNGTKTQVTANHKFLTNNGWVRADKLTNDMEIIDINTYS